MMASRILFMLSLCILCMMGQTQVAPVYRPGGGPAPSRTVRTSVRVASKAVGAGRARKNRFVTETVYGFLDFTTTVGSTVMVFTPQSETEKKSAPSSKKVSFVTATPMSTLERVKATKTPQTEEKRVTTTSTTSSSSSSSPSGLARLLQRARTNEENPFSFSSKPLRHSLKKSQTPGLRNREFILPNNRRRIASGGGGSTIVPILIEGQGGTKAPILESSIYVPEEVVVSASQSFAPLKVITSSSTEAGNEVRNHLQADNVASKPTPTILRDRSSAHVHSSARGKPTGLVTTLGGTIISDGQTTIHKTSVIGTYVSGKYAQVLKSTSRIFQDNPSENLITPTHNNYETVKAVIEGSATKFFNPEQTASLPIESLFSSAPDRAARYEPLREEEELSTSESKLTKRRGANPFVRDDYYYYYDSKDQLYDDEYDDLVRAGSGLRPSFRPSTPRKTAITPSTPTLRRSEPASTFRPRFKSTGTRNIPPSFLRNSQDKFRNRFQLSSNRPKLKVNRKQPPSAKPQEVKRPLSRVQATPKVPVEETIRVTSTTPSIGPTNVWLEIATMRSLHSFRIGPTVNTRYATYTKTFTHTITPTSSIELSGSENTALYEDPPLFENILEDKKALVATLPPINLDGKVLNNLLKTTTETFRTTETMYKTSVLPVKENAKLYYHTLTQTYWITRIVSAIKTIPPIEAFEFVPSDSLNEFNSKLLAEGTEHEAALLPGEREYDENKEIRVPPPPGFKVSGANLADLAGGNFNPEALEKQMNPQLAAAIKTHSNGGTPQLSGTKQSEANSPNTATPPLSPEALQLAYLRLMNPYFFGGLAGSQQTVTSSPVLITTDITTTSTSIIRVIFNARPIMTTISNIGVTRTTITSYITSTIAAPSLPGLPFGFPGGMPFPTG